MSATMVAALFVQTNGCYFGLPDVVPYDGTSDSTDARKYAGPWPTVCHSPCGPWGRYWFGGPQWLKDGRPRKKLGDDGGCFASALNSVRTYGGVLEHPAGSHAWEAFGLLPPPRTGGWVNADLLYGGWTCCVDQGWYGHPASKATWLYAVGVELPLFTWNPAGKRLELDGLDEAARRRAIKTGVCQRLSKRKRAATPIAFRDLLLGMARSVRAQVAA